MRAHAPAVDQRAVVNTALTLSWQGVDQFGEPADPGVVTVTVSRADGSVIVTSAATSGTGVAERTYSMARALNNRLDLLTAVWLSGGVEVGRTRIGVQGSVYLPNSVIRGDKALISDVAYPPAAIRSARERVETIFEDACNVAFVPRLAVQVYRGNDADFVAFDWAMVRRVVWITAIGPESDTFTASAGDLAALSFDTGGIGWLRCGSAVSWPFDAWRRGYTYTIGYEHGFDRLPADLVPQAVMAIRQELTSLKSGVPSRAQSYQPVEGGSVVFAGVRAARQVTGIPSVDDALAGYDFNRRALLA